MERKIGNSRTFERYGGKWKITNIEKDVNKQYEVIIEKPEVTCPYCGKNYYQKKKYNITYIETLQSEDKEIHLGVSDKDNYIILEEGKELINGN